MAEPQPVPINAMFQDDFVTQLAPARTFVFKHEADDLRARGMGQHLSPKDLLVISDKGPIENSFRFADVTPMPRSVPPSPTGASRWW